MKRVLITCTAIAALGLALALSSTTSLTARLNNAERDLQKVQAPIPHHKLHNRALEILHDMEAK